MSQKTFRNHIVSEEDWLLDIVLWYELKLQKEKVKGDARN